MNISIWLTHPLVKSWNFTEEYKRKLENLLPDCSILLNKNSESFKKNLEDTEIAIVWVFKQNWLRLAPKLKWIATPAAGKDWFTINQPEGMTITYSSFHGKIITETVIGAMLGFSRGLYFASKFQDKYLWPRTEIEPYCRTIRGSRVVILGFGKIGTYIAKLLKPFGAKITGIKRTSIKKPDFFDQNDNIRTIDDLDIILPEADHLILALPADKSTNNILNKERLKLLSKNCFVYNIGRGNAINEIDLANVLQNGEISGAYLDVFIKEPLDSNSPLRNCPNLLITPHSSAIAPIFFELFIKEFVFKYKQWIEKM
ncbi:MAG: D-2-hydroxyacid dehydrogenase [Candidatus Hermodarchaeota archaeon]